MKADELLEHMKAGATVQYFPYRGRFNPKAYYVAWGKPIDGRFERLGRCTSAARSLLKRGLVEKANTKTYSDDHELVLPTGEAAPQSINSTQDNQGEAK